MILVFYGSLTIFTTLKHAKNKSHCHGILRHNKKLENERRNNRFFSYIKGNQNLKIMFAGSAAAMNTSIKNNRNLVGKRNKYFDTNNIEFENTELEFEAASDEEVEAFRLACEVKRNKTRRQKRIFIGSVILFCVVMVSAYFLFH